MQTKFTLDDFSSQIKIDRRDNCIVKIEDNFDHRGIITLASKFDDEHKDYLLLKEIITLINKNYLWLTKEFMKEKNIDLNKNNWWR
jgi:hypothetical protein